jgi:autotransporter-associated beta strand protein
LALPINNGTGTVGLSLTGAGTFVLSSASTFSGGLSVSGGGTFQEGVASTFSGSPALTLSNGTYSTGSTTGYSATLGTLTVGAGNATISLGTGSHTLTFANSSSITWGAGNLTINNWTGFGFSGGTAGKIMVGVGGLSNTQLAKITFTGYTGTPMILSTGELVPAYASPSITTQPSTGTQTVCQNGSLTALSISASAGTAAISTYQWYSNSSASTVGATAVSTGTGYTTNTFTLSTSTGSALYYYCVVKDANGATSTSGFTGLITVNANATPAVTITPTSVSTCSASSSTINFSINTTAFGGTAPTYVWKKLSGGVTTQVATGSTYSPLPSAFSNGDQVYAVMTSNYSCLTSATAQSASTTLTITTSVAPVVTASNSVTNSVSPTATICNGASVTFTATNVNSVGSPSYQWYDGTTPVGTGAVYTTSSLSNNDQVKVVMSTSDVCASAPSGTSAITTVTVNPTLTPSAVVAAAANPVCTGTAVSFSVTTLTNCGSSPTYLWYKNNVSTGITTWLPQLTMMQFM